MCLCFVRCVLNAARVQVDGSVVEAAGAAVAARLAIWETYHDCCLAVAQWTTTPLLDARNCAALDIAAIKAAVDDFTARSFHLSKHNKVRCMRASFISVRARWSSVLCSLQHGFPP